MVVVFWWSFVMALIFKYAQTVINMFKHYDPMLLDEEELPDGPMKDFYEETTLSHEWLTLNEEEKRERLDKELNEYMSKSKPKHE